MEISQSLAAQAEVAFAKSEVHDLIVAQARGIDRAEEALLRSLWHPGATVDLGSFFSGSAEEFCDWILGVVRSAVRMMHSVANQWVQVDGNQAVGETYVIALDTRAGEGGDVDTLSAGATWTVSSGSTASGSSPTGRSSTTGRSNIRRPIRRDDADGMYAALRTGAATFPTIRSYAFWKEN